MSHRPKAKVCQRIAAEKPERVQRKLTLPLLLACCGAPHLLVLDEGEAASLFFPRRLVGKVLSDRATCGRDTGWGAARRGESEQAPRHPPWTPLLVRNPRTEVRRGMLYARWVHRVCIHVGLRPRMHCDMARGPVGITQETAAARPPSPGQAPWTVVHDSEGAALIHEVAADLYSLRRQ